MGGQSSIYGEAIWRGIFRCSYKGTANLDSGDAEWYGNAMRDTKLYFEKILSQYSEIAKMCREVQQCIDICEEVQMYIDAYEGAQRQMDLNGKVIAIRPRIDCN